jgi:hypothetical protein
MKEEIVTPKGEVRLTAHDADGNEIWSFEKNNLIVMLGRQNLAQFLITGDTTRRITTVGFGTDGTLPASGDTGLTGTFSKAIGGATSPAANQVQFLFGLLSGENNGMAIRELGLFTAAGDLFARLVIPTFNKVAGITLNGTWKIIF